MKEYLVRPFRGGYQISKWSDYEYPIAVYHIYPAKKGWNCDSLGCVRKTECKHSKLVEKYLKLALKQGEMQELMFDLYE